MVIERSPWALLALLAGCAWLALAAPQATPPGAPAEACRPALLERMFFGMQGSHGPVTEPQWQRFVDEEIGPRFPAGSTVVAADGRWQDPDGRIEHEPSRVVEILRREGEHDSRPIAEIIERYKARHGQHAVLWLRTPVSVCL